MDPVIVYGELAKNTSDRSGGWETAKSAIGSGNAILALSTLRTSKYLTYLYLTSTKVHMSEAAKGPRAPRR